MSTNTVPTHDELIFFQSTDEDDVVQTTTSPQIIQLIDALKARVKVSIQCRRPSCTSTSIIYRYIQTRSLDEGMTTIFTCADCEFTWRSR